MSHCLEQDGYQGDLGRKEELGDDDVFAVALQTNLSRKLPTFKPKRGCLKMTKTTKHHQSVWMSGKIVQRPRVTHT